MSKEEIIAALKPAILNLLVAIVTVLFGLYGANAYIVTPLLAEQQAEGRGGSGVTRFSSPVQFQAGATVDSGLTVASGSTTLGALDMGGNTLSNVGNSSTDFDASGGLQLANGVTVTTGGISVTGASTLISALNMSNAAISNIGNANTDFSGSGGLTLANNLTVTGRISATNGITVTGAVGVEGAVDLRSNVLSNVGNSGTDFDSSGGLTLANAFTVTTGGATLSDGNLTIADFTRVVSQTALTVTDGATFTPTGTYQALNASGTVTPVLSTSGFTAGFVLILSNASDGSIVLADSGNIVLSAAITLGQHDTLTLLFDGVRWIQLATSNN